MQIERDQDGSERPGWNKDYRAWIAVIIVILVVAAIRFNLLDVPARPRLPARRAAPAGFKADALDVVISAKTPAATLGLKDVEEEITEALSRLNRAFL